MPTINRYLQGTSPTTIAETDILQFAGATFNSPVYVGEYNDSTHVKSLAGSNLSASNTPNNVKFISQDAGAGGDSQADWGDGVENIDQITNAEATLKLTLSESYNITASEVLFFSFDPSRGSTQDLPRLDVRAAEVGDTNFVRCEGVDNALVLGDRLTPATSHDFYILISKSPLGVGLKSDKLRFEALIQ